MYLKQSLSLPELDGFKASEGWLDKQELNHGIKEDQISGECLSVFETTVESWMERIKEFCKGYDQKDIWNINESGCFLKALPGRGLAQKGKKAKVEKRQSRGSMLHFQ